MKKIFTLIFGIIAATTLFAQNHGPMKFEGPSNFSNTDMGVSVDNQHDTIVFTMKSMTAGDITIPTLHYAAMNMVIPSYTIADAPYSFDMSTMTATFEVKDYDVTVTDANGNEKHITGQIQEAVYCGTNGQHTFKLTCTLKYGNMPLILTYTIDAVYVREETSLNQVENPAQNAPIYDLTGKQVSDIVAGRIYFQNGRKFICR